MNELVIDHLYYAESIGMSHKLQAPCAQTRSYILFVFCVTK